MTNSRREISKAELAEAIWTEQEREHARKCLATALWRLKKVTGANTSLLVLQGAESVSLNRSTHLWADSMAMEKRLAPLLRLKPEALSRIDALRLERGLRLYRGDYLVGMDHEWAWLERQRLHDLYCNGLYHLIMVHAAHEEWSKVLIWGRHLCREEPLREDVHRLLMLACLRTGSRASAIAQYRQCQRTLATEIGIEPMEETQLLYRQLVRRTPAEGLATPPEMPPTLETAHRRIGRVRRMLVMCQRQLDRAADSLAAVLPRRE